MPSAPQHPAAWHRTRGESRAARLRRRFLGRHPDAPPLPPRHPLAQLADLTAVLAFAAIGRRNHGEGSAIGGIAATALPFLIGAALAWMLPTVRRSPLPVRSGARVAAGALVPGMLIRRFLLHRGTALPFVIVAAVFLFATIVGWRALAGVVRARQRPATTA